MVLNFLVMFPWSLYSETKVTVLQEKVYMLGGGGVKRSHEWRVFGGGATRKNNFLEVMCSFQLNACEWP